MSDWSHFDSLGCVPPRCSYVTVGSGFSEDASHRPIYLNALSPVVGTVWKGLGSVALLEEMYVTVGGFEVSEDL